MCRSFLHIWPGDENKFYGRMNIGVSTVNLPYVACESQGDEAKFWQLLDHYCELCHSAQKTRAKRLCRTRAEVAPILWCDGALARLKPEETLEQLITNGYCSSSLGYAGLYECVERMKGVSHTSVEGKPFALRVMQFLNDKCNEWKAAEGVAYSVYGTPIEATTYKFAEALKRDFGEIADVSEYEYVTNSYHVCVREPIDAFTKLKFESEFQKLSPGGMISYCEIPNMQNNIPAVLTLIRFIYDNIMYAELNTKSDYCQVCGFDGEIQIVEDENKKLIWRCPNCGNTDQSKMNVVRRTCGYLGSNFWNEGQRFGL